jgi:solute carrier family 35, member C2
MEWSSLLSVSVPLSHFLLLGGFKFPILYTTAHMCIKYLLSRLWARSSPQILITPLTWTEILTTALPIGFATSLDVMFSNYSLLYISITLYTIIKASILIWTFLWGILFQIEPFHFRTLSAVFVIFFGISLAVFASTDLSFFGIFLVMIAAACGGIRWVLVQKLLTSATASSSSSSACNSMISIYHFSPYSALSILPFGLYNLFVFVSSDYYLSSSSLNLWITFGLIVTGGIIAFYLILTEVYLVQITSSLTLGVLGQIKEMVQIVLSIIVFHDAISWMNGIGVVIAVLGVWWYKSIKLLDHLQNKTAKEYQSLAQVTLPLSLPLCLSLCLYLSLSLTSSSLSASGGVPTECL